MSYDGNNYYILGEDDDIEFNKYYKDIINDPSLFLRGYIKVNYLDVSNEFNDFKEKIENKGPNVGLYPSKYDGSNIYKIYLKEYYGEDVEGGKLYATVEFDLNKKTFKIIEA